MMSAPVHNSDAHGPAAAVAQKVAEAVVSCLNGGPTERLAPLCIADVTIRASLDESAPFDAPFKNRSLARLDHFRHELSRAITGMDVQPSTQLEPSGAEGSGEFNFGWTATGRFRSPLAGVAPTGLPVIVHGHCAISTRGDRVSEVCIAVDLHDFLSEQGALCPGPGEVRPRAEVANAQACELLVAAITGHSSTAQAELHRAAVHALVKFYSSDELELRTFYVEGSNELPELLEVLATEFSRIRVELPLTVSQGRTSTSIGHAEVTRDGMDYTYCLRIGVRSSTFGEIDELWVELYPPPTLREVFS